MKFNLWVGIGENPVLAFPALWSAYLGWNKNNIVIIAIIIIIIIIIVSDICDYTTRQYIWTRLPYSYDNSQTHLATLYISFICNCLHVLWTLDHPLSCPRTSQRNCPGPVSSTERLLTIMLERDLQPVLPTISLSIYHTRSHTVLQHGIIKLATTARLLCLLIHCFIMSVIIAVSLNDLLVNKPISIIVKLCCL